MRVPWQAMLVIGAPASGEGGAPTAAWAPYAQQRTAERAQRGRSNSWSEEMERANEAERARNNKRKAEVLLLKAYGEPGEASETGAEGEGAKRRRSGEQDEEGGNEAPTTAKEAYKKKRGKRLQSHARARQKKREANESRTVVTAGTLSPTQESQRPHQPVPSLIVLDPNDGL